MRAAEGKVGRVEMALREGKGRLGKAKENLRSSRRLKEGWERDAG